MKVYLTNNKQATKLINKPYNQNNQILFIRQFKIKL